MSTVGPGRSTRWEEQAYGGWGQTEGSGLGVGQWSRMGSGLEEGGARLVGGCIKP